MATCPSHPAARTAPLACALSFLTLLVLVALPRPARASDPARVTAVDGTWSSVAVTSPGPPDREDPATVYDPVRHRMIVFGGYGTYGGPLVPLNDMWSLSLDASKQWTSIFVSGGLPPARLSHTMVYDSLRDRVLVYGGGDGSPGNVDVMGDVWSLSLSGGSHWTLLTPSGTPPPARLAHAAIYDPVRDRMIVFGGFNGTTYLKDTWELDLAGATPQWALMGAATPPALTPRDFARAIYDPDHDRMLLCGGNALLPGPIVQAVGETWALNLSGPPVWTQLALTGPGPRLAPAAAYDPNRHRAILFGGYAGPNYLADTWSLDLAGNPTEWQSVSSPTTGPSARVFTAGIYDPVADQFVVFAGADPSRYYADTWFLSADGSGWQALFHYTQAPRMGQSFTYDPNGRRGILFGGAGANAYFNDAWNLDLASSVWSIVLPTGTPPSPRTEHVAALDAANERLIVFGGFTPGALLSDVWALSLSGAPAWTQLIPAGTPPPFPVAGGAYDPTHHQLVVVGGQAGSLSSQTAVWTLSLDGPPAWTMITPGGGNPIARRGSGFVYDALHDRFILFGGTDGGQGVVRECWALRLTGTPQWIPGPPLPIGLWAQAVAVDDLRGRALAFAGANSYYNNYDTRTNGVLAFDFSAPGWQYLSTDGDTPFPRYGASALFDHVGDRLAAVDGWTESGSVAADLHYLQFADNPTPVLTSLVDESVDGLAVHLTWYSPAGAGVTALAERCDDGATWATVRTLTADGSGQLVLDDVVPAGGRYGYRLRVGAGAVTTDATWLEASATASLALLGATPNPAAGPARIAFSLRGSMKASLAVFDVRGRAVLLRDLSTLGPGAHTLSLARNELAGAGVYVVRLTEGDRALSRKIALLP